MAQPITNQDLNNPNQQNQNPNQVQTNQSGQNQQQNGQNQANNQIADNHRAHLHLQLQIQISNKVRATQIFKESLMLTKEINLDQLLVAIFKMLRNKLNKV